VNTKRARARSWFLATQNFWPEGEIPALVPDTCSCEGEIPALVEEDKDRNVLRVEMAGREG